MNIEETLRRVYETTREDAAGRLRGSDKHPPERRQNMNRLAEIGLSKLNAK